MNSLTSKTKLSFMLKYVIPTIKFTALWLIAKEERTKGV
jgi:hypothetical protein